MANRIRIDSDYFDRWASQLTDVSEALTEAAQVLNNLDTSDGWWRELRCNSSIRLQDEGGSVTLSSARNAVSQLEKTLRRYYNRVNKLSDAVRQVGISFDNTETQVTSIINGTEGSAAADVYSKENDTIPFINAILNLPEDSSQWTDEQRQRYNAFIEKFRPLIGTDPSTITKDVFDSLAVLPFVGGSGMVVDIVDTLSKNKIGIKAFFENGGYAALEVSEGLNKSSADIAKHKRDKELFSEKQGNIPDRKATILEYGIEEKAEIAWKHDEAEMSGKYGSAGASYSIGKAEGHSSLHAGLYVTEIGPDGKERRVLEPGISAEIGASITGIEAETHGQLGNDNLGISGKVGASALKAEASTKLDVGFVDGDISARASASAEAILGEIEGEAAVHVAGVEGKVAGSVNFGIGAHADIGYSNGKLAFDVGASVGVGASVKVELDVGGLVDNVGEFMGNAWDNSQQAIGAARGCCESFLDNAAKNLSNWWKW